MAKNKTRFVALALCLTASMLFGRDRLVKGMVATCLGFFCPVSEKRASSEPPHPQAAIVAVHTPPPLKAVLHPAPVGVDYSSNPTVFGKILRGEIPSASYVETDELYSFRDKSPSAPLHALVIPKRFIPTVATLLPSDADLVSDMKAVGTDILRTEQPDAYASGDYILCFHIPPFNSVQHLHLHVLAPASEMSYFKRYGKYQTGTTWCTGVDDVIKRLRRGERAVRSALWGKA